MYKDHLEWENDLLAARRTVQEIESAIPKYYHFFRRMVIACFDDSWSGTKYDDNPARENTQEVYYNNFKEYMEEWCKFSYPESKKIWQCVKDRNEAFKGSKLDQFDTKKMYAFHKSIQKEKKAEEEELSECCGAPIIEHSDFCSKCKCHTGIDNI